MARRRSVDSFKHAVDGIVHTLRTQRHMRFHFAIVVLVLGVGALYGLDRIETLILLFTISMVLMAEMFNTALEAIVDLTTEVYHPLAKFAKDIAAGAVLITTLNAMVVGFLLFFDQRRIESLIQRRMLEYPSQYQLFLIGTLGMGLLFVLLILWKARGVKGTFLRGGIISGHSALGFFGAVLILYLQSNAFVALLANGLAVLVAQSRVEAGIHTVQEVVIGALVGLLVPLLIFTVLPYVAGFKPYLPKLAR